MKQAPGSGLQAPGRIRIVLIAGLGLAVIAIVVAILVSLDEDPPAGRPTAVAPPPASPPDAAARIALPRHQALPDGAQILPVRDHRTDVMGDERPEPAIIPQTVAALRPILLPIVKKCSLPLRSQVPVQKGRLVITSHVKSQNGKVSVAHVAVRQDLVNDAELVDCVTKGFLRATMDGPPEQDDGEQDVSMAFPVP
jgi:hypothetical protein